MDLYRFVLLYTLFIESFIYNLLKTSNKMKGVKKSTQASKKVDVLKGNKKKIYNLLLVNPTTKYVVDKMLEAGKAKGNTTRDIVELCRLGYIERIDKGVYKVSKNHWALSQGIKNQVEKKVRKLKNLSEEDYLRLHGLEIQLNIPYDIHRQMFNVIFKKKKFNNIRSSGTNKGYYFEVDESSITFMITKKNLFAKFPVDWEINSEHITELMEMLYDEIKKEVNILETRYKIPCFKDGRVNFNIRKMHIALVNNGVAKEFVKNDIDNLVVYDEEDGKPRFIMDMSKLRFELEAVHSKKAFNDADEAQHFMNNLKDGNVRDVLDKHKRFFSSEDNLSNIDIKHAIMDILTVIKGLTKENEETAAGLNTVVQYLKYQIPTELNPAHEEIREKPYYVG